MNINERIEKTPAFYGFRKGNSGAHTSRSMMLNEIRDLFTLTPLDSTKEDYAHAIIQLNVLDKPTEGSRLKSNRNLIDLYSLDGDLTLFRVLRQLYKHTPEALPQLALITAFCRDALLRTSFSLIAETSPGQIIPRTSMEIHFEKNSPGRFSETMKKSLSQNVNTSWTFSGHLSGRSVKTKTIAPVFPVAAVYAMLAAYILGYRGELALTSPLGHLISCDPRALQSALADASSHSLCDLKTGGGIVELHFPQLLTEREIESSHA